MSTPNELVVGGLDMGQTFIFMSAANSTPTHLDLYCVGLKEASINHTGIIVGICWWMSVNVLRSMLCYWL